ncbi:MAG TPA: four helix bundle protein [Patescibacteria group bacterium]|nr:four helix bundle protein [Patescibacteria group bacterium]
MKITQFEDIIAWQKSRELFNFVYSDFRDCKDFAFRDQIQRAVVSIANNIAEGFERRGDKEFKRFLFMSKGSCGEVRSLLYFALDLNYIDKVTFEKNYTLAFEVSKILSGFIKTL